jgi:hypothetical protein
MALPRRLETTTAVARSSFSQSWSRCRHSRQPRSVCLMGCTLPSCGSSHAGFAPRLLLQASSALNCARSCPHPKPSSSPRWKHWSAPHPRTESTSRTSGSRCCASVPSGWPSVAVEWNLSIPAPGTRTATSSPLSSAWVRIRSSPIRAPTATAMPAGATTSAPQPPTTLWSCRAASNSASTGTAAKLCSGCSAMEQAPEHCSAVSGNLWANSATAPTGTAATCA